MTQLSTILESSPFLMSRVQSIGKYCGFYLQVPPLQSHWEAITFLIYIIQLTPNYFLASPLISSVSIEVRVSTFGWKSDHAMVFPRLASDFPYLSEEKSLQWLMDPHLICLLTISLIISPTILALSGSPAISWMCKTLSCLRSFPHVIFSPKMTLFQMCTCPARTFFGGAAQLSSYQLT